MGVFCFPASAKYLSLPSAVGYYAVFSYRRSRKESWGLSCSVNELDLVSVAAASGCSE